MTCKCGVDHEARVPDQDLRDGENHLGSLPRGRTYTSRAGRLIFAYAPAAAPHKCRRNPCGCATPDDRADCSCVPVRINAGYGMRSYTRLPYGYPVIEAI